MTRSHRDVQLQFVPLDDELIHVAEPWFDDTATQRYLGGRNWIHRELRLLATQPGSRFRERLVIGRYAWLVRELNSRFVGYLGCESYDDASAGFSVLVAPEARGRGLACRMLRALDDQPELGAAERFVGSVEPENLAAQAALRAAGFEVAEECDDEGMFPFRKTRGVSQASG